MQFEVIREEIIRLPYQRENISLDKIHKSTEKGKRGPRGPYKKRQQVDHE